MDDQADPSSSSIHVGGSEDCDPSETSTYIDALHARSMSTTRKLKDCGSDEVTANADDSPDDDDRKVKHGHTDVMGVGDRDENDTVDRIRTVAAVDDQDVSNSTPILDDLDESVSSLFVQELLQAGSREKGLGGAKASPGLPTIRDRKDLVDEAMIKNNAQGGGLISPIEDVSDSDSYYSPSSDSYSSSSELSEDMNATFESIRKGYERDKGSPKRQRQQVPEGSPAPAFSLPEPGEWLLDDSSNINNHQRNTTRMPMSRSGSQRIPRSSRTGRGPGSVRIQPGGGDVGSRKGAPGRGHPGRGDLQASPKRKLAGNVFFRNLSGSALTRTMSGNKLGLSSPGDDDSPKRGSGRGGGLQGRGRGQTGRGLRSMDSRPDINDEASPARREKRGMFKRAATERFVYRPEDDDKDDPMAIPRFKRRGRSASMGMGADVVPNVPDFTRSGTAGRYSVTFGASREQSHFQPKVIRKSHKVDIRTGGENHREVICQRIIDYPLAMNPAERRRKMAFRTTKEHLNRFSMHGEVVIPQYRLQSKLQATGLKEQIESQTIDGSQTVHLGAMTSYLIWSLRSHFLLVLFSELFAFWCLTTIFAVCIYLGATYQPECLRFPGAQNFEEAGGFYQDAFTLSWTTFSTVGYGMIHPQIQREGDATSFHCAFMTTIVSLESFVGVLFASFCGAVMVGKMTRAKSTASIRYSRRMILRFGTGVMYTGDDDHRCDDVDEMPVSEYERRRTKFPSPVLEFRVANSLFGNDDGEIMDAKINVVASTLANRYSDDEDKKANTNTNNLSGNVHQSFDMLKDIKVSAKRFIRKKVSSSKPILDTEKKPTDEDDRKKVFSSKTTLDTEKKPTDKEKKEKSVLRRVSVFSQAAIENVMVKKKLMRSTEPIANESTRSRLKKMGSKKKTIRVEEDPSGLLAPAKMFSSIKIETETHPFFKRVWTLRHVLNADSPLLSPKASRLVKESKGFWPAEACTPEFIRENVKFQQLIVSMSGTIGASKVYGLNVYEYRNLHVGYAFASILEAAQDGRLEVDLDSIDTIREQRGGRAEPIDYFDANQHSRNFFTGESSEFHLDMNMSNKSDKSMAPFNIDITDDEVPVAADSLSSIEEPSRKLPSAGNEEDTTSIDFRGRMGELLGSKTPEDFPNTGILSQRRLSFDG